MHEIDLKNFNIRTDLVIDNINKLENNQFINIVEYEKNNIKISKVTLDKDNILEKKEGIYITISFDDVTDKDNRSNLLTVFIDNLKELIGDIKNKKFLIIGLGNVKSTPDAIGPKTIENILVTRYLYMENGIDVDEGFSNTAAFIPGVFAETGIESSDVVLGLIDKIKPDMIIVIDSLASSSIDRINKTIQLTNTGIAPGSGVGNKRCELSLETLSVPVIAIGVPTVIDGVTIVSDTINYMKKKFSYSKEYKDHKNNKDFKEINYKDYEDNLTKYEKEKILGLVGTLNEDEIKKLIFEVLSPIDYNLMVTVKEIDFVVDNLSNIISEGINRCLHKSYKKI